MSTAISASTANPRIIRVADCPPQPWKNGGGVTRELLVWPSAADCADWQIRISVADITQDGVFSSFEGVARSFAVIEGAGVRLTFSDCSEQVTQASKPLQFDGAAAPMCTLMGGATRDLNLMCRSGASAALVCAYSGQTMRARGFFDKASQTLMWLETPSELTAPQGVKDVKDVKDVKHKLMGWWVV